MARPQLKAVGDAKSRSPERESLGKAIEAYEAVARQLTATQQAIVTATNDARDARGQVEASEAAIETAKHQAATFRTEQALGTAGAPPVSIKDARAAARAAEDELEAATTALAGLETQHKTLEGKRQFAEMILNQRLQSVLQSETGQFFKEYAQLQDQLAQRRSVLLYIQSELGVPAEFKSWDCIRDWPEEKVDAWPEAIDALAKNADAPLPMPD